MSTRYLAEFINRSATVTPPAASVSLTGLAPTVTVSVESATAAVTVAGQAPEVASLVQANTASITVVGHAPAVSTSFVLPPIGGYRPLRRKLDVEVRVSEGRIWIIGLAPKISATSTYEEELVLLV